MLEFGETVMGLSEFLMDEFGFSYEGTGTIQDDPRKPGLMFSLTTQPEDKPGNQDSFTVVMTEDPKFYLYRWNDDGNPEFLTETEDYEDLRPAILFMTGNILKAIKLTVSTLHEKLLTKLTNVGLGNIRAQKFDYSIDEDTLQVVLTTILFGEDCKKLSENNISVDELLHFIERDMYIPSGPDSSSVEIVGGPKAAVISVFLDYTK